METEQRTFSGKAVQIIWRGLVTTIRQNAAALALAACLAVVSAIAISCFIPFKYTATANVFPTSNPGIGSSSSSLDLSSIAGGMLSSSSLLGGQHGGFDEFKSLLTSPQTAEVLFQDKWIRQTLLHIDPDRGQQGPGLVGMVRGFIRSGMFRLWGVSNAAGGPTPYALGKIIKRDVAITSETRSNMLVLRFADKDPAFARYFLGKLVTVSDTLLRKQTLAQTQQYINFLNRNIGGVTNRENSEALIRVLTKYQETLILTSVNVSYAAEIVGGILVPMTPDEPKPAMVLVLGTIGFFIAWLVVLQLLGRLQTASLVFALRQSGILAS